MQEHSVVQNKEPIKVHVRVYNLGLAERRYYKLCRMSGLDKSASSIALLGWLFSEHAHVLASGISSKVKTLNELLNNS